MFIVLEVQTYADGTIGTLVNTFADRNQAESKYHLVLSSAAVSNLPMHTAFLLSNDGYKEKSEVYIHEVESDGDND